MLLSKKGEDYETGGLVVQRENGELIEVDGNAGVLRLLDDGETGSTESGTQQSDLAEAANA